MEDMLRVNRTARPSDCKGFQRMFAPDRLTLGVFFPIEAFAGDQPTMLGQERLARRAEELGYAALWCRDVPPRDPSFGDVGQVPKPITPVPMLVTGHSGQPLEWIANHADGWITYPRGLQRQAEVAAHWHAAVETAAPGVFKPLVQSFYVDLSDDPDAAPTPIHLGFRGGRHFVLRFFEALRSLGVNHVILNFKYGARNAGDVLEEIGQDILPQLTARQGDGA